jgi:hypothetical protein
MATFKQFNQVLLESNNKVINYQEYVIKINNGKYDLSTFDLISNFIIEEKYLPCYFLYTYGVLSGRYNVKKVTEYLIGKNGKLTFKYEVDEDFKIIEDLVEIETYDTYKDIQILTSSNSELIRSPKGPNSKKSIRGPKQKIFYIIHPNAFIRMLSRANQDKHSKYIAFIIECNIGYNSYTSLYKEREYKKTIEIKDDSINQLRIEIQQQHLNITMLLQNQHEEHTNQINKLQSSIDKITTTLKERAIPPDDLDLCGKFIIMCKDDIFYDIRSQELTLNKIIKKKERDGFVKVDGLIESETIPNSIYLWNIIKDHLKKSKKIVSRYNSFTLQDINKDDLIELIKIIFDRRLEYN